MGSALSREREGFFPVRRLEDGVTLLLEVVSDELADVRLVLDDQDLPAIVAHSSKSSPGSEAA